MEKQEFFVITVKELSDLIRKHFKDGKNYNIAYENEWINGQYFVVELARNEELENIEYGKNLTIKQIKEEWFSEQVEYIIWSLACKGFLPFDDYLIDVSW